MTDAPTESGKVWSAHKRFPQPGTRTPPSMRTVSPLMNQLLTRLRTSAPMSVLEPWAAAEQPSSGGGCVVGTLSEYLEKSVTSEKPRAFEEPGADISDRKNPGRAAQRVQRGKEIREWRTWSNAVHSNTERKKFMR